MAETLLSVVEGLQRQVEALQGFQRKVETLRQENRKQWSLLGASGAQAKNVSRILRRETEAGWTVMGRGRDGKYIFQSKPKVIFYLDKNRKTRILMFFTVDASIFSLRYF